MTHTYANCMLVDNRTIVTATLTIIGSCDLETQQVINLSVSFLTTLIEAIRGCLVASSPVQGGKGSAVEPLNNENFGTTKLFHYLEVFIN